MMEWPNSPEPLERLEARLADATGDAAGMVEIDQAPEGGEETPLIAVVLNSRDGTSTVVTSGFADDAAWVNVARVRRPGGEMVDVLIDGETIVRSPTTII